jgi:very-short-patch-repair endonuclease
LYLYVYSAHTWGYKKDPDLEVLELAGRQWGVISRQQCRSCGLSDTAITYRQRHKGWRLVLPGVLLLPGFASCLAQKAMGAQLWGGDEAVVCDLTAGALWQLTDVTSSRIHVYARKPKAPARSIIEVRRTIHLPRCDIEDRGPLRLTSPTRTLIDLAAHLPESRLERALDRALLRGQTSLPRLRWRLDELARPGFHGIAAMKHLLDQKDPRNAPSESDLETLFNRCLRRHRLPAAKPQHVVREAGRPFPRIDFVYLDLKLGIEVVGREGHAGPAAQGYDADRHNRLTNCGWTLLYFTWHDVTTRGHQVAATIRRERERLQRLGRLFG